MKSPRITKICPVCREPFIVPTYRAHLVYCSRACFAITRRKNHRQTCEGCGSSFVSNRPDARFCSRGCRARFLLLKRSPKPESLPKERWCPICCRKRVVKHFFDETGGYHNQCDSCRQSEQAPTVKLYRCRDCGKSTTNRFYCPACLHEREHGGGGRFDDAEAA